MIMLHHIFFLSCAEPPPVFTNCPETDLSFVLEEGTNFATITVGEIVARNARGLRVPVRKERVPEGLEFDRDLEVTFEEEYREGFKVVYNAGRLNDTSSECVFRLKLVGKYSSASA